MKQQTYLKLFKCRPFTPFFVFVVIVIVSIVKIINLARENDIFNTSGHYLKSNNSNGIEQDNEISKLTCRIRHQMMDVNRKTRPK